MSARIDYVTMTDDTRRDVVVAMMRELYAEDPASAPVDAARFPETIRVLLAHPERGRIVLLMEAADVRGYALLIPYWSNEFGGTLVFIDELFVMPEARGRGLGRGLVEWVKAERPHDAVAVLLEVSPANVRARRLYESLGFVPRENALLVCRVGPAPRA